MIVCSATAGNNPGGWRILLLVGRVESMTMRLADLGELVERHYVELYRYARRLSGSNTDAEDLVQEAFLTLQAKGGQVREPAALRAWLYRVVRNAFLQHRRAPAQALRRYLPEESFHNLSDPASLGDDPPDFDSEALQAALLQLPEEYRSALVLHYFGGLICREIAGQLQVPLGTVLSRISRGKALLREYLQPGVSGEMRATATVTVGARRPDGSLDEALQVLAGGATESPAAHEETWTGQTGS